LFSGVGSQERDDFIGVDTQKEGARDNNFARIHFGKKFIMVMKKGNTFREKKIFPRNQKLRKKKHFRGQKYIPGKELFVILIISDPENNAKQNLVTLLTFMEK
jgi:hypothetical protein